MGARLKSGDDIQEEMSEINVTPFIDVMLVLLIIFMVAAPLATVDIPVDLPSSQAQSQPKPDKPVYLTLKTDLTLALGDDYIESAQLAGELDKLTKANKEERIFLRADEEVDYGDLMGVMNQLRTAGYLKIALVGLDDLGANKAQP
ncbi:MAG: TonB system transport protein ExbD [Parvibaculaceae bacterium]|nr:TonB system transport protein ExbD [Parvibaculaceae bacterium]